MAAAVQTSAMKFSGEEALLDVYDLQWKAIDIRMEKLRNECERMILEYEVEIKQQMYLRECEDLLRQSTETHEQQQAKLEGELRQKDRQLLAAEKLRSTSSTSGPQQKNKPNDKEEGDETVVEKPAKEAAKRQVKPQIKAVAKTKQLKAVAAKAVVPKPVSPPVYSPEDDHEHEFEQENGYDQESDKEEEEAPPKAPQNDLLDMLSLDYGNDSDDFKNGDQVGLSLIHPESPAMLSPVRLKKHKEAQRKVVVQQNKLLALQLDSSSASDASDPSIAEEDMPLGKRALKRRKTAVNPVVTKAPANKAKKALTEQMQATAAKSMNGKEKVPAGQVQKAVMDAKTPQLKKPAETKPIKQSRQPKTAEPEAEPAGDDDFQSSDDEAFLTKQQRPKPKKAIDPVLEVDGGAITGRSKARQLSAKAAAAAVADRSTHTDEAPHVQLFSAIHDIATPKVPRKKMGIDGKMSKQRNDLALKRAEFQQMRTEPATTIATTTTTATAAVIATTRYVRTRQDEGSGDQDNGAAEVNRKKRRRHEQNEETMDAFQTPVKPPAAKKPKVVKAGGGGGVAALRMNQFANDELNIMKSPVPLLRAKLAEKKKQEMEEKNKQQQTAKPSNTTASTKPSTINNTNKRPRDDSDDNEDAEAEYGSPARAVSAFSSSSVLPAERLPAPISIKKAAQFPAQQPRAANVGTPVTDYASRWLNSGLVTRAKKNAVKRPVVVARKPMAAASTAAKPIASASLWGDTSASGGSFFDAFVNATAPVVPRLNKAATSLQPKQ